MSLRTVCVWSMLVMTFCSGCAITAVHRSTQTGVQMPPNIFSQVVDGETSKDWLIQKLGLPTVAKDRGDGMEDLIYERTSHITEHITVLFLIDSSSSEDRTDQWVFELKDDVVQKHYLRGVRRHHVSSLD